MYTTITERTREIGILKSLGASKAYIISVILKEAALLTLVGVITGYVGAMILRKLFWPLPDIACRTHLGLEALRRGAGLAWKFSGRFLPGPEGSAP